MTIAFREVYVKFDPTDAPQKLSQSIEFTEKNPKITKINVADAAIKGFKIQYTDHDNHDFGHQRVTVDKVTFAGTSVTVDVLFELTDDGNYAGNKFEGAVLVLVIADVTLG